MFLETNNKSRRGEARAKGKWDDFERGGVTGACVVPGAGLYVTCYAHTPAALPRNRLKEEGDVLSAG